MNKEAVTALLLSFLLLAPPVFASDGKIDVTNYDLTVQISPDENKFSVLALVEFLAKEDGVTEVNFSFNEELEIDIIGAMERAIGHERHENTLTVSFDSPLQSSEKVMLVVDYLGIADKEYTPGDSVWGYVGNDGSYMIYEAAWYPMVWGDRAMATVNLIVPEGQTGITVGTLLDSKSYDGYSEFIYEVDIPVGGISFAAGVYETRSTFFGHIPATVYAYPDDIWGTELTLATSKDILDFYSKTFSEYPYKSLKIVEIPDYFMGGHGDQGMIMLYSNVFKKEQDTRFLAHELAHNWWGAQVSAVGEQSLRSGEGLGVFSKRKVLLAQEREDHNLWIIEGFATYSSMMYTEHTDGKGAMIDYLETAKGEYLSKIKTQQDEPIINAGEEYGSTGVYHAVVYSKGALVLHMLRYVVGEETFLEIMNTYPQRYGGKSATVADFQALAEEISGRNLGWFFDEWVRDTTLPDYALGDVSVTKTADYLVNFNVHQAGDLAKMPVDVTLYTTNSKVTKRVWVDKDTKSVSFTTSSKPLYIEIDPDHWILESDRSNNRHVISYPRNLAGVKLLLAEIIRLLS